MRKDNRICAIDPDECVAHDHDAILLHDSPYDASRISKFAARSSSNKPNEVVGKDNRICAMDPDECVPHDHDAILLHNSPSYKKDI